jgi:hypothetical protein
MHRPVALLLGLGFLSAAVGCRNCDLLEAELRTRENELRELRAELARADAHNEGMLRELGAVRQSTSAKPSPELASQTYTLKQIVLGRQTGGYDDDGCPGDEALQVVLEPRDADGHAIKAPGALHVEVLEINPQGLKAPLSSWDLSPDQLRRAWRSGLLSTGYQIILPWKVWPSSDKLRVIVQFTLADGRLFEADKDITIRPTVAALRRSLPAAGVDPTLSVVPGPENPLPAPRKLLPGTPPGVAVPPSPPGLEPASLWQPARTGTVADAVQLLRPTPLANFSSEGRLPSEVVPSSNVPGAKSRSP